MEKLETKLNGFMEGGAAAVIGIAMTLIIGIIGLQILNGTINLAINGTANMVGLTGLPSTILTYAMPLFGVGLIVVAVGWAFAR